MNENVAKEKKESFWSMNAVSLKVIIITLLILLLMIPNSMVKSIIAEREFLSEQVIHEVNSLWAGSQEVNGPILTIPLVYEYQAGEETREVTKQLHILPEELFINGEIVPEKLRRGIYEVVVYNSSLKVNGKFNFLDELDSTDLKEIQFEKAFITVGISDLRGIRDEIMINCANKSLGVKPGTKLGEGLSNGVTAELPDLSEWQGKDLDFNFNLNLQGSQNITFVPIGNTTEVALKSDWSSPKFEGNFLPDVRDVSEAGFSATWKILELNRNIPQQWMNTIEHKKMENASFGVDLILPLDDYQKSMRSAKYAIMTIGLTFLIFFLVEILNKKRIHPLQYILVGLALILFYILLVSISEQSNFNLAFSISALTIITMITLYSRKLFKSTSLSLLLMATLTGIYAFVFVTLQLEDYALLLGSIVLTVILGATMYFTRNINWYELSIGKE